MITNIRLYSFKSFLNLEVEPRRITVFIGANGTGKSSVLQSMILIKQSIGSSGLKHQGNLIQLAKPEDIYSKLEGRSGLVGIEFSGFDSSLSISHSQFSRTVNYRYGVDFIGARMAEAECELEFEFEGNPIKIDGSLTGEFPVEVNLGDRVALLVRNQAVGRLFSVGEWRNDPPSGTLNNELNRIVNTPASVLEKMRLVPPIRGLSRALYRLGENLNPDIFQSGGQGYVEDQTVTNLGYSRSLETKLSSLLERVTGVGLRADIVPQQSVEPKALTPVGDVNIVVEGFGTNALILLFHQLASADRGSTILVEEPEIHLHPRAQAEVASAMMREAKDEDKQLIITTHSEHILGRFLTLVAEKQLTKDELAIYAFVKDAKGECTATALEVTDEGRVKGGLKDFFETDLDELDRYMKALRSGR